VTPFANLIWSKPAEFALQYRAANPLDALLASLEAIPTLSRYPQYRRFFSAMLPMSERSTFADLCISALSGKKEQCFSRLLSGDAEERLEVKERIDRVQQDVLLIGHGGGGTGLSRNSRMLENALDGGDIALTTLSYETEPDRFADALRRWYAACGKRPIVIAAINAQDIPAVFARDRHGVLEDCHVVGFFLWETSKAPSVQRLGISLVDEIWVPTHYVAEVYAHLARTFVVGKGLFHPDDKPTRHLRGPGPLRFLTVFDFHSSIERKNPLASVLAFRNAFQDAEDVEMVVKASNVNPQHPGNALGQWERLCLEAAQDSRIRIITERYSEGQMNSLLSQADCVVSLHRSEGFGYVLADAMALGIPVIATAYSGNLDFCDADTCFPVDYRLVQVQAVGTHWESEGAVWADADTVLAAAQMRRVYEDYPLALHLAATGQDRILGKYSTAAFATTLRIRISAIRNTECAIDRHS
jgi:glycosyltransferase involved in cell wall biosynthesis